jgi:hypothetical protein
MRDAGEKPGVAPGFSPRVSGSPQVALGLIPESQFSLEKSTERPL